MQSIQDATILASLRQDDRDHLKRLRCGAKTLRKATSISSLYHAATHPFQTLEDLREAVEEWNDGISKEEKQRRVHHEAQKALRYMQQRNATNLQEWEAAAKELDILEGNDQWKKIDQSEDYDAVLLQENINALQAAKINGDVKRMLYLVRTTMSRDMAGMSNLKLYQYSHLGTKERVETYIRVAIETLEALVEASDDPSHGIGTADIYNNLLSTRQSFGRSAMLLSGGGTFGMNHIGVLKALWQARLLPRIISGASAGSIVASIMCTRIDEEIPALLETFCHGDLAVFHDPNESVPWLKTLARLLVRGNLFDIQHLTRVMKGLVGNMTFLEAYNRTRRILNICVSSASMYELPKLLNYVTSPHVMISSAVAASCSVPLVFSAAGLLIKDPKTGKISSWTGGQDSQKWIDGSVDNDLPMQRLSEMFNVNHFIVSQVNPHVVPFLARDKDVNGEESENTSFKPGPSWFRGLSLFAKTEVIHRMTMLSDAGIMPNVLTKLASVLSQTYSGDITILPEISFIDFPTVLSNPTTEFMQDTMLRGERATWPKLSRIRNHCAIELSLDNALNQVRAKTVFSESEARLRRKAFKRTQSDDGHRRTLSVQKTRPRQFSQSSDPGTDMMGIARRSTLQQRIPSGESRKSSGPGQNNDGTCLSPAPGLTSDDGLENSSLSSSEEENYGDSESAPAKRQRKPLASLPPSPTDISQASSYFQPLDKSGISPLISPGLAMTPIQPQPQQNSPEEARYKRLFHGKGSVPVSGSMLKSHIRHKDSLELALKDENH